MMYSVQNFSQHYDQILSSESFNLSRTTFSMTSILQIPWSVLSDTCCWQLWSTISSNPSHSFLTLVILGLKRLQDLACLCNAVYRKPFMESVLLMFGTHAEQWSLNENAIKLSDSSLLLDCSSMPLWYCRYISIQSQDKKSNLTGHSCQWFYSSCNILQQTNKWVQNTGGMTMTEENLKMTKKLCQCHSVHPKSHMNRPGIEPRHLGRECGQLP